MKRGLWLCLCWCLLTMSLPGQAIEKGMPLDDVNAVMGPPKSRMQLGDHIVLLYDHGGRIELEKGAVISYQNLPISVMSASKPKTSALPKSEPAASPKSAPVVEPKEPEPSVVLEETSPTKVKPTRKDSDAALVNMAEDPISSVDIAKVMQQAAPSTGGQIAQALANEEQKTHESSTLHKPPVSFWIKLSVMALMQFILVMTVLKIAFWWSEIDADWRQMIIPALADVITKQGLVAVVYGFWHGTSLFHLEDGVAFFVMLFVLQKTTHACTLARAVTVVMSAKVISIFMISILATTVLQLLFG